MTVPASIVYTADCVVMSGPIRDDQPRRWFVYADSAYRALAQARTITLHTRPRHSTHAYAIVVSPDREAAQRRHEPTQRNRKNAADTDRRKVPRDAGVRKLAELPWVDCKIAFGIDNDEPLTPTGRRLPVCRVRGWDLIEVRGHQCGCVAIFRVRRTVIPTKADGAKVAAWLVEIGARKA